MSYSYTKFRFQVCYKHVYSNFKVESTVPLEGDSNAFGQEISSRC